MKQILNLMLVALLFSCNKGSADSASFASPTGQGGSMARFTIVNNYLYTVDKQNLKVFNITNVAQPVFERSVPVGFEIETIYPFGDKLFIGSTSVVHIFSITDPSVPKKLSVAISPTVIRRCDPVVAKDSVAFATLRATGECGGVGSILAVYDIKDITKPVQKGQYTVSEPFGLGYSGNVLYVCDRVMGLMVFDISQPYTPVLVRAVNNLQPIDVIPYNNVLIVWTNVGMNLYDITVKLNPVLLTQIN
ncbi:MAG TPA: hypothetical protein VEY06_12375 [Flavisolibacter sp.]|jgi:hypothetical protein|nr:hypothetical protein [Flavisolibacter sp.]